MSSMANTPLCVSNHSVFALNSLKSCCSCSTTWKWIHVAFCKLCKKQQDAFTTWNEYWLAGMFSTHRQGKAGTQRCTFCVGICSCNIVRTTEYCTNDRILFGRRIVAGRRHNICWAGGGFYTILLPHILLSTAVLLILHFLLISCRAFVISNKPEAQVHTAQTISVKYQRYGTFLQNFFVAFMENWF